MAVFVSGSVAYDTLLSCVGKFSDAILPEKLSALSVSFYAPGMRREAGGTGHNVAYTAGMLGCKAALCASVGRDFDADPEKAKLIDYSGLRRCPERYTACAQILSDEAGNQVTAFHPGAMEEGREQSFHDYAGPFSYAMVSPNDVPAMARHLREAKEAGVPVFYDPGQAISYTSPEDLKASLKLADYLVVNEYEHSVFCAKTGVAAADLVNHFKKVVVTLGAKGARVEAKDGSFEVASIPAPDVKDPTGAGDAWRGGLLAGLDAGLDWETSARMGTLAAWHCVRTHGTQNHRFTKKEFAQEFERAFGKKLELA